MKNPIPIKIYDWDFVLSAIDRHQIENLIWLQVSPHIESVVSVKFEIVEYMQEDGTQVYRARCFTNLRSCKTLESIAFAPTKVDAIVELGKQLRADVNERVRYESTAVYRGLHWGLCRLSHFSSLILQGDGSLSCGCCQQAT